MSRLIVAIVIAVLVSAGEAVGQIPPGFYVQQITENEWQENPVRMNDLGQMVFARRSGPDNTGELVLYDARTDAVTQLTDDEVVDAFPDINSQGVIAWTRFIGPPGRFGPTGEIVIMRPPYERIERLTDNDVDDVGPRINDLSHVVWTRLMGPGCFGATMDIYFHDGQTGRPITTNGVPEGVANQSASLNSLDEVVWAEYDFCINPWESRVMFYSDGEITQISSEEMFEPQGASINNRQQVTWSYLDQDIGDHPIVIWENGSTRFLTYGRGALLNDRGHVAFSRWHNDIGAWQPWLYRNQTVYRISDDPFGVVSHDINESGEVVMLSGDFPDFDVRWMRRYSSGDLNCDGSVDLIDVGPFITALLEPDEYPHQYPNCDLMLADINGDGSVDLVDIEPFIELLLQ